MQYDAVREAIGSTGLMARGAFAAGPGDAIPEVAPGQPGVTVFLIGIIGSSGWNAFAAAGPRGPHPLARWTRERIEPLAQRVGARAVYPEDVPYLPFQQWARRAEDVHASPLGLMIHPEYGLWHSYRAALLLPWPMELPPRGDRPSPCATCEKRPCLQACPVGAFDGRAFDSGACRFHLAGPAGADCLDGGCRSRNACPVGVQYRYAPAQMRFHMAAFNAAKA